MLFSFVAGKETGLAANVEIS